MQMFSKTVTYLLSTSTITYIKKVMTEFGYAKRDLCLAAYGGVVLQRFEFKKVCMEKNGNRHYS